MLVYQRVSNKTSPKSSAFVPLEPKHQSFPAKITPFHRFFPNVLEKMATESYPPRPGTQRSLEPCDVFVGPLLSAVRAGDRILEDSEGRSCHPKKGAGRKKLGVFFGGQPTTSDCQQLRFDSKHFKRRRKRESLLLLPPKSRNFHHLKSTSIHTQGQRDVQ